MIGMPPIDDEDEDGGFIEVIMTLNNPFAMRSASSSISISLAPGLLRTMYDAGPSISLSGIQRPCFVR